jgi:hypothetical protein
MDSIKCTAHCVENGHEWKAGLYMNNEEKESNQLGPDLSRFITFQLFLNALSIAVVNARPYLLPH